jgi:hypothetical protein
MSEQKKRNIKNANQLRINKLTLLLRISSHLKRSALIRQNKITDKSPTENVFAGTDACTFGVLKWMTVPEESCINREK